MKILYACHQFFPEYYTGTERYTLELARQMQKVGHQVMVLTYAHLSDADMRPVADGQILYKTYQQDDVPVIAWRHADFARREREIESPFREDDEPLAAAFDQFLDEHQFDLLHATHLKRVFPLLPLARRRHMKIVLHLTDYWMICPKVTLRRPDDSLCDGPDLGRNCRQYCFPQVENDTLRRYQYSQKSLQLADVVISPSQFLIDTFQKSQADTSRFVHSRHGFDYGKVTFYKKGELSQAGRLTFGFLGTVLPHKGVHTLIEAFRQVPGEHLRLKIYGGSFHRQDYYQALQLLQAGDTRIEFCGEYDFDNVAAVLQDIDVIVAPSLWYENAPLVISTAHAFGIPVITTNIGGMAEMVQDGVDGFTFRLGDSQDLSEKIQRFVLDPSLLATFEKEMRPPPRIEGEMLSLETLYQGLLAEESRNGGERKA